MRRKITAGIVIFCMLFSMIPTAAFASTPTILFTATETDLILGENENSYNVKTNSESGKDYYT